MLDKDDKYFSIGLLSKATGIGIETIRFYERKGLLKKPVRTVSGYRRYTKEAVKRLLFVKRAKALGFTLAEIAELLSLNIDPNSQCKQVKQRADQKIVSIQEKIDSLQKMKNALENFSSACSGKGAANECPILEALDTPIEGEEDSHEN